MRKFYSFILFTIIYFIFFEAKAEPRIDELLQLDPGGSFTNIKSDTGSNKSEYKLFSNKPKNLGLYSVGESLYLNHANGAVLNGNFSLSPLIEGLSGKFVPVYFDGVELNFIGDNSYDAAFLPLFSARLFRIDSYDNDGKAGLNSLGKSLTMAFEKPVGLKVNSTAFGGNNYGSFNFKGQGSSDFVYWNTALAYSTTKGYDLSEDSKNNYGSLAATRENSYSRNLFFLGKAGIRDITSDFSFSYLTQKGSKGIPGDIRIKKGGFLSIDNISTNLFNCLFTMDLNNNLTIVGNFFYKKNSADIDSSLDASKLQNSLGTTIRQLDGFSFGGNFSGIFSFSLNNPFEFSLNYVRNSLSDFQPVQYFYFRNETEMFSVSVSQKLFIGNDILLKGWVDYASVNPVMKLGNTSFGDFNEPGYGLNSRFLMTEKLIMRLNISRQSRFLPLLTEMNLFEKPDTNLTKYYTANSAEINFSLIIESWLTINGKAYYTGLDTKQFDRLNPDNGLSTLKSDLSGLECSLKIESAGFHSELTGAIQSVSGEINYEDATDLPGKSLNFSIGYDAGWGTGFSANFLWHGDRRVFFSETNHDDLQDYNLINCIIYQKISDKYYIFIRANNILDRAYDFLPGYPALGFNFTAGVELGI